MLLATSQVYFLWVWICSISLMLQFPSSFNGWLTRGKNSNQPFRFKESISVLNVPKTKNKLKRQRRRTTQTAAVQQITLSFSSHILFSSSFSRSLFLFSCNHFVHFCLLDVNMLFFSPLILLFLETRWPFFSSQKNMIYFFSTQNIKLQKFTILKIENMKLRLISDKQSFN
jgi:hypothetical protein